MMKTLALTLFAFAACATSPSTTSSSRGAIIDTPCTTNADCPTGYECESEVEHGTTHTFCQAHDDGSDDTADDHGSGSGSDDGSGSGSDDHGGSGGSDDGSGHH